MMRRPLPHVTRSMSPVFLVLLLCGAAGMAQALDLARVHQLAEQGDANAQWTLGTFYYSGQAVSQDYQKAHRWFRSAADRGHALALRSLGTMYRHGQGVPQDEVQAYVWYSLGAMPGSERARMRRDEVAR